MSKKYDLGFVGFGNMGKAIARGLEAANSPLSTVATDVNAESLRAVCGPKIAVCNSIEELAEQCGMILLAVKPVHAAEVCKKIMSADVTGAILISILAGTKIKTLKTLCPKIKKIVRVMPNLAAQQLKSMSVLSFEGEFTSAERAAVKSIFDCIGKTEVAEERLLDAVTAVSGSGPAYVYRFIQSFAAGGAACGLSEEMSLKLVLATVEGACKMVEMSGTPIDKMVEAVCSKGGTTIEAVNVLDGSDFDAVVKSAVGAAYNKSVKMSEG